MTKIVQFIKTIATSTTTKTNGSSLQKLNGGSFIQKTTGMAYSMTGVEDVVSTSTVSDSQYSRCSKTMQIFLVQAATNGKTKTLDVYSLDCVAMIKVQMQEMTGIPVDQQRLIYLGMELENGRTLLECNIRKESTVHLVLRLKGGMLSSSVSSFNRRSGYDSSDHENKNSSNNTDTSFVSETLCKWYSSYKYSDGTYSGKHITSLFKFKTIMNIEIKPCQLLITDNGQTTIFLLSQKEEIQFNQTTKRFTVRPQREELWSIQIYCDDQLTTEYMRNALSSAATYDPLKDILNEAGHPFSEDFSTNIKRCIFDRIHLQTEES